MSGLEINDGTMCLKNNSNSSGNEVPSLPTRLVFASVWILIAVAGILGNSLVIFIAVRFQKLNNVTNCFIVNLAVTDIVFLAFCMPLRVLQYTLEQWYFNQTFCKLMNFISYVSVLVTVLTLVTMTIDRYIYIAHPFENITWRKPRTVFLLSLIIWLLSCAFAFPFYLLYGIRYNDHKKECVLSLCVKDVRRQQFRIYTVTLYYFIPLTIILICYTRLLYYVRLQENKLQAKSKSNAVKWSKKRRAVTQMVAIVTLVFSLCWLPITLSNLITGQTRFLYYFKMISPSFAYLNSAVNPIIYAFLNRSFRNNCGNILSNPTCGIRCRKDSPEEQQRISKERNLNYQPTNRENIPLDPKLPSSPHRSLDNDFSEAEDEGLDPECYPPMMDEKAFYDNNRVEEQLGTAKIEKKIRDDRPLTRSL